MDQRVSLITVGVDDPELAAGFYEDMGWKRVSSPDGVIAFDLIGQTLGLYPLSALAEEIGVDLASLGHGALTLSYNCRSKGEVAQVLDKAGLTRQDIAAEIATRCVMEADVINNLTPGFARSSSEPRRAFTGPEQVLVLMAGGSGLYSMVMPSWCAGEHLNAPSSVVVEADFFCELPGLASNS